MRENVDEHHDYITVEPMTQCNFCEIVQGREDYVIWEDEHFMLILDTMPAKRGSSMVIPKKHVDYIFDLDDSLYTKLFSTVKQLSVYLKKVTHAKRIGIVVFGFEVPHVHIHLIPLHKGNELFNQSLFKKASDEELKELRAIIQQEIASS